MKLEFASQKAKRMQNHPKGFRQVLFVQRLQKQYKTLEKLRAAKAAKAKAAKAAGETDSETESETEEDFSEGPHDHIVAQVEKLGHPWYAQRVHGNTWKVCKYIAYNL